MASSREYYGNIRAPEFPANSEWINITGKLSLEELRGKLVLLDFWTYGCINCMHIIPDLKKLEDKYPRELVVIGVHSAKFRNEANPANLRKIIERYEITHPVVNDHDMAIWESYAVRAWPTSILIDPHGRVLAAHSGEGVYDAYADLIRKAVEHYDHEGVLDRKPVIALTRRPREGVFLSFPGKVIVDPVIGLVIADSGHHRIVLAELTGQVKAVIGSGQAGLDDGGFSTATFNKPQGLAVAGNNLYVADTGNHALRLVDLAAQTVSTLAGDGHLTYHIAEGKEELVRLNSPWDLLLLNEYLFVAMAGLHQVYIYNLTTRKWNLFAGSGREGLTDGARLNAAMAQPSGLAYGFGKVYVADSEASAIREVDLTPSGQVRTLIGEGLFEFGDVDGARPAACLQHALGVAFAYDRLYIADTYNHKVKVLDLHSARVGTFLGGSVSGAQDGIEASFYEPGGLAYAHGKLYIADTNNHVIRVADVETRQVGTLDIKAAAALNSGSEPAAATPESIQPQNPEPQATLQLSITLPNHHKLTPGQLSQAAWEVVEGDPELQIDSGTAYFTSLDMVIHSRMPARTGLMKIRLVLYYCDEKDELCLMERRVLQVPLDEMEMTGTVIPVNVNVSSQAAVA